MFRDYYSTQFHAKITQNIDKFFNDKQTGIVWCMINELCIGIVTISCSKRGEKNWRSQKFMSLWTWWQKASNIYVILECFLNDTAMKLCRWKLFFFNSDISIHFQRKIFVFFHFYVTFFHPISFSTAY